MDYTNYFYKQNKIKLMNIFQIILVRCLIPYLFIKCLENKRWPVNLSYFNFVFYAMIQICAVVM